jgi:hypothetical protein
MYAALMLMVFVQTVALPAATDDTNIYDAVLGAVIRPEIARMMRQPPDVPPPAIIFAQTIARCEPRPAPSKIGCLRNSDIDVLASRPNERPFEKQLSPAERDELFAALRANTRDSQLIAISQLHAVVATTEQGLEATIAQESPRTVGWTAFSRPGYTSDGIAVVYAKYTCGSLCGYGWLILLRRLPQGWRVIERHMLWVS